MVFRNQDGSSPVTLKYQILENTKYLVCLDFRLSLVELNLV
nr:MAG TPA: hypothetical protein [Caudoviricetes sp.]